MSLAFRCRLFFAAIALAGSTAFGAAAPGLEVIVRSGSSVVFEGVTDFEGRFATVPLPPGIYTFEVRVPKTIPTLARYSLALSGAKPVTEPLMRRDIAIMMDAQVRSPRPVRGQVTARNVTLLTPPATASPRAITAGASTPNRATAPPPATVSSSAPALRPAPVRAPASTTPSSTGPSPYQQRVINGRLHVWEPLAPGSRLGRWVPEQPGRVRAPTQAGPTTAQPPPAATPSQIARASAVPASAATQSATPRPAAAQRRIINGKWHVWQPSVPGSTLGRWVPEQPAGARVSPASAATRTNAPATAATPAPVPRAVAVRPAPTSPAPTAPPQRRIINGKWHVWEPAAPGSTAGRWAPEQPRGTRAVVQPATTPAPTPSPTPARSTRSAPRR